MHRTDLAVHPLAPVPSGVDPFTLVYGGHVTQPDGTIGVADVIISAGRIAEIGSCICLPAGSSLINATGSLVAPRGRRDTALAPGDEAALELVPLSSAQSLNGSWNREGAAQH